MSIRIILLSLCVFIAAIAGAQEQVFSKGDTVQLNSSFDTTKDAIWITAEVVEVKQQVQSYVVRNAEGRTFMIPFNKATWMLRTPINETVTVIPVAKNQACKITVEDIKQQIREETFASFPDFENILISYTLLAEQKPFTNTETGTTNASTVSPYLIEYYIDVTTPGKNNQKHRKKLFCKRTYWLINNGNGDCKLQLQTFTSQDTTSTTNK